MKGEVKRREEERRENREKMRGRKQEEKKMIFKQRSLKISPVMGAHRAHPQGTAS